MQVLGFEPRSSGSKDFTNQAISPSQCCFSINSKLASKKKEEKMEATMSGARTGRDILSRGTNWSREDTHDQDNVTLVPSILDDADGALPTRRFL